MNGSKKDTERIIKEALLGSENPTKKGVSFVIFCYALLIAMIAVWVFWHDPFAQFIGMGGVFGFIAIAQGLVIGLTDNSDRYIWQVINQVFRRAKSSTINDALLELLIGAVALLIGFGFSVVAFVSGALWLIIVGICGAIVVIFAYMFWRIWTIARQVKARRQQERTA